MYFFHSSLKVVFGCRLKILIESGVKQQSFEADNNQCENQAKFVVWRNKQSVEQSAAKRSGRPC